MSDRGDSSKDASQDDATISSPDTLAPSVTQPVSSNAESSSSRWYLYAKAFAIRNLATVGFALQHRSDPAAMMPTSTIWIDSTLSQWKGEKKFSLDIWTPPTPAQTENGRICMISLHGGGFVLGTGTDDARWAGACVEHLDAVVVAVNYRMAPGYPFPTPVEDCADAILHVAKQSKELGIDPDKIFLSGFSAGGNLAFAAYHLLNSPSTWSYPALTPPKIRGIVAYYPLLDWTIPRNEKKERSPRPEFCMPESLTGLFDQSYLYPPPPDRKDARISPGIAPDDMIKRLPPVHLCCCEYDMLLQEAETFKERLEGLDMPVKFRSVTEEKHGWDKPPPMIPKESVLEEYLEAIQSVKGWLRA